MPKTIDTTATQAQLNKYTWFCEPKTKYTDTLLANMISWEYFYEHKEIENGEERPLYEMDQWSQVSYLMSIPDAKFNLYNRDGRYGKIRQVNFMLKKNASAETRQKLEEMFQKLNIKPPKAQPAF